MSSSFTRRKFVASSAALPFALRAFAQPTASERWMLLGTGGQGIFRCSWDAATGKLGKAELAIKTPRPDFFAMHPTLPRLYSVCSIAGPNAGVSSFHVDVASGGLEFGEHQTSLGDGPCYVSVDHTGQLAFATNYAGASLAAYPLGADGSLKPPTGSLLCRDNVNCGTHGPANPPQNASHLHCAIVSPNNDFVLVCDLGNDSIEVLPIHPGAANPLGAAQRFVARTGSGPRHLVFHPNGRWVYVIHELDATVEIYDWAVSNGIPSLRLREISVTSTLAAGIKLDRNTGCEISISPDGRFLYTCSRGVDEFLVFRVDQKTGTLTEQQRISCGGKVPRYFGFDPSRRWLLCTNQGDSTVTVFSHNANTGRISGPTQTLAAEMPMFVQFI